MPGEQFPNTPDINEGEKGPDDGGFSAIKDGEEIQEAPARDGESTKFGDVAEGTEFGVNEDLEAQADKILAEAEEAEKPEHDSSSELETPVQKINPVANETAENAEEKVEVAGVLPDGTKVYGTAEDYNEALKDYYENIRDIIS